METIRQFFKRHHLPLIGKKLLIAVSAGPDSMALLDMASRLHGVEVCVAHVDHQLREDSDHETILLKRYCQQRRLPLYVRKWPISEHPETGIEAAARQVRYDFFRKVAGKQGCDYLLTAHHGDDLAENLLLKLLRSGNVQEMTSLAEVSRYHNICVLRPLLSWSKDALADYDRSHNIQYIFDETNGEDITLRNRLRHHVMPLLKRESPHLLDNVHRFADSVADLTQAQEAYYDQFPKPRFFFAPFAYFGEQKSLAALPDRQKLAFWQVQICRYWHRHVRFDLQTWQDQGQVAKDRFQLVCYRRYYFLIDRTRLPESLSTWQSVQVDVVFQFYGQSFLITQDVPPKTQRVIGTFHAEKRTQFSVGSLPPGAKLALGHGKHGLAKKKFSEASICRQLRPYCLSIRADNKIVFVSDVYQNQDFKASDVCYHVVALVK